MYSALYCKQLHEREEPGFSLRRRKYGETKRNFVMISKGPQTIGTSKGRQRTAWERGEKTSELVEITKGSVPNFRNRMVLTSIGEPSRCSALYVPKHMITCRRPFERNGQRVYEEWKVFFVLHVGTYEPDDEICQTTKACLTGTNFCFFPHQTNRKG